MGMFVALRDLVGSIPGLADGDAVHKIDKAGEIEKRLQLHKKLEADREVLKSRGSDDGEVPEEVAEGPAEVWICLKRCG